MRKKIISVLSLTILFFMTIMTAGCSVKLATIHKDVKIRNGERYVRLRINENLPNIIQQIDFVQNVHGVYNDAYSYEDIDWWKPTVYEAAYYAKKKGYKSIYFIFDRQKNLLNEKMVSSAQDLLKVVPDIDAYPFMTEAVLYKTKPIDKFTVDTDDILKTFAPYKLKNIVKRVLYGNFNPFGYGIGSEKSMNNPIGNY